MKLQVIFLLLSLVGCGSGNKYLDASEPEKLMPCPTDALPDASQHAYLALQTTLSLENWVVENLNTSQFIVQSRKCIRNLGETGDVLKRDDKECASLQFKVEHDGYIIVRRVSSKDMEPKVEHTVYKWLEEIDQTYSEIRCYSEDLLQKLSLQAK